MILTLQVGRKLEQDDIWWIGTPQPGHTMVILQPPQQEWYCSCFDHGFGVRDHKGRI